MQYSLAQDLILNARLLLYLLGTFIYGFLARELLRRPSVMPGNRPMRILAACLTLWYAGCLLDELANILLPGAPVHVDVALDLLYDGLAWSTVTADPQAAFPHPYSAAQQQAQDARRGLWSDEGPIPPWAWRAGGSVSSP